ncbi:MAG: SusC/RagA family TonB-linked outer membrane protein, partial [Bacteroidales bacterium]|nr:SusC/RagA family TonB-linked outer membrane protein [Bacteroidales bacterium]
DEVVVIGYGSVKRANLTGAVTDIKADEIEDVTVGNLSSALEGRLVGVKVGQSTGIPGAETTFRIRTVSSYSRAREDPLFVIDGVIRDKKAFDLLDPSEVKSISILKDAAAAVYGIRAVGGVVLVETKHGIQGKTKVNYSGTFGIAKATQFPEMLNARELATMWNDILDLWKMDGNKPSRYDYYSEDEMEHFDTNSYNWIDELWKNAYQAKHTFNVSGGTEKVNYFTGASYHNITGSLDNLYYQKYSLRTSLDAKITDDLTASLGINYYQSSKKQPYFSGESQEDVLRETYKQALTALPWVPPTIDGYPVDNWISSNPYALLESGSYKSANSKDINIQGSLEYKIPFIKGLKIRLQYSLTEGFGRGKQYAQNYEQFLFKTTGSHRHIIIDTLPPEKSRFYDNTEGLQESTDMDKEYQLNTSINYNRTIGKHDIAALLVYEQSESESEGYWTRVEGGADVRGYEYLWAYRKSNLENGSSAKQKGNLGYIGRINYSYAQKYLVEATFRYEASPKWHPDYRWGFFPSVSTGWVVSEEQFFKNNISFISFLKFRGSAGLVGNDNVDPFMWKLQYKGDEVGAVFGQTQTNGIKAKHEGVSVPKVTWQKTRSYNIGMDIRFFEEHIILGMDYYYRFTYDILNKRQSTIPTTFGITGNFPEENYGEMYAKGFELELGYNGKIGNDLRYYAKGNFSWDKARPLKLFQNPTVVGSWKDELKNDDSNQPGYICLGVINTQEELDAILAEHPNYRIEQGERYLEPQLGMLYYKDVRGNHYIDSATNKLAYTPPNDTINGDDMTIIAEYTNPPYYYGFSLGASYKGLKVDLTFSGAFGHKVFISKDEQALPDPEEGIASNVFGFWSDYWTPENPDAGYPRPYNYGLAEQNSTFWMRDGHTLRLTTINISYRLPANLTVKWKIPELRLFFTAGNIWTIINPFDHKDPSVSRAYDYPMMRTYNFGINFTL